MDKSNNTATVDWLCRNNHDPSLRAIVERAIEAGQQMCDQRMERELAALRAAQQKAGEE